AEQTPNFGQHLRLLVSSSVIIVSEGWVPYVSICSIVSPVLLTSFTLILKSKYSFAQSSFIANVSLGNALVICSSAIILTFCSCNVFNNSIPYCSNHSLWIRSDSIALQTEGR